MARISRFIVPVAAGLVVVAVAVQTASAQDRGRRGGGFGRGASELRLLNSPQVQKELDLLDEQKKDIQKLIDDSRAQMRDAFSGLRDLSREERREKFAEMREKMRSMNEKLQKELNEVLLPHQQDRLKQIALQLQGNQALSNPEVAAKLGLSDKQKDQLAQVQEEGREKMREMFTSAREAGGDREAMREKFAQMREDLDKQIEGVLTADQKRKLEEMRGEPFELDRSQLRGGRDRGDRGRGDRNRRGNRDRRGDR
jgi:Spy/CpxP family protein refolding chaperone